MPNIYLPLPESDKNISRQAVFAIVRQVMEITNIAKETMVLYKGESESVAQHGSAMASAQGSTTVLAATSNISVEVTENYTPNGIATTAIARLENQPLFADEFLEVMMRPVYSSNELEIVFTYKDKSRTKVKQWRDDIRNRASQMRDINMHKLEYHYSYPREFLKILYEIWRLREKTEGYGQDFETYLFENNSTKLTQITNQAGKVTSYAVAESQIQIEGMFDFDAVPQEITKGTDAGIWVAEFTYKATYDKPTACHFRYPIMIHNELLDKKYLPEQPDIPDDHQTQRSLSQNALHYFQAEVINKRYTEEAFAFRVPKEDEFIPNNTLPELKGIVSALCQIDPSDKRYLLDLAELGDVSLDRDVLDFFRKVEWTYLSKPLQSAFNVSVFRHSYLTNFQDFYVDSNLQVRCVHDLSLRKNFRVVISLVKDIEAVNPQAWKRLKLYPKALIKVLSAVRATRNQLEAMRRKCDMTMYGDHLPKIGFTRQEFNDSHVGFNTVMAGYVVARDGVRGASLADAPTHRSRI